MARDFLDEVNFGKKKADESAVKGKKEKTPRFQNIQEAATYYKKKAQQETFKLGGQAETRKERALVKISEAYQKKRFKQEIGRIARQDKLRQAFGRLAPVAESLQQAQAQQIQGQRRQGVIRQIGSMAEKFENQMLAINETKFLNNMESARMQILSPPNRWLQDVENSVVRSMPD